MDLKSIPGEIKNKIYVFPDIKYNNNHWIITVKLYKNNELISPTSSNQNINNVRAEYAVNDKTPTIIRRGKQNRNVFEQAVFEAFAKWTKYKEKHTVKYNCGPPMIVKVWDLDMSPDKFEKIDDSWIAQRKYNGVRCIACKSGNKINLISRHFKPYSMPHIEAILQSMPEHIMLDGELYKFGAPLQEISGIVRGADLTNKDLLWYQVFDLYDMNNKDAPFVERYDKLKDIIKTLIDKNADAKKYIKISPNVTIGQFTNYRDFDRAMTKIYKDFLDEKYEGIIIRAAHAPYEPGVHGRKTDYVYKHKPKLTMEFKIVDYTTGRGKEAGAVIWICETKRGDKFNVRPKWTYEERARIYKQIDGSSSGFNKYKNKMLTVEYDSLSLAGIPQQPRAIAIRDYE